MTQLTNIHGLRACSMQGMDHESRYRSVVGKHEDVPLKIVQIDLGDDFADDYSWSIWNVDGEMMMKLSITAELIFVSTAVLMLTPRAAIISVTWQEIAMCIVC